MHGKVHSTSRNGDFVSVEVAHPDGTVDSHSEDGRKRPLVLTCKARTQELRVKITKQALIVRFMCT